MDLNRRQFLKVLGITGAAATVEGCAGTSHDKLIPYLIPVESIKPGQSTDFATVCRECPAGCGMIARVRDGRAHKVEGNPDHPINRGALCLRGHASLQGLYNPDRITGPMARDEHGRLQPVTWEDAERRLQKALFTASAGRALWIGRLETGTMDRLIRAWLSAIAPNHTRVTYEPFAHEPLRVAAGRVFGSPQIPRFKIADARMLISFGADFLETWLSNVEFARDFAAWRDARRAGKHTGRYVFIGPRLSLTGANADEWIPVRAGAEGLVARALETAVNGGDPGRLAEQAGVSSDIISRLAREFKMGGPSLALPVGVAGSGVDATEAIEAVLRLNKAAGNVGRTVIPGEGHALSAANTHAEVAEAARSAGGAVVFLHHVDPAYNLPGAGAHLFEGAKEVVSFASYLTDTTAKVATLVLPDHTPLESWGDYTPRTGVTGLMQPAVAPVFNTRATGDVLLASASKMGRDLGAATFQEYLRKAHKMDDDAWNSTLQKGVIAGGDIPAVPASARGKSAPAGGHAAGLDAIVLHVYPSLHFYDGRSANRPWAQEIPDPMAKAVWGSWAEIHPDLAKSIGARNDDVLVLTTAAGKLEVPALVTDKVHPKVVAVQIGQGHAEFGRYAKGAGVNAVTLLPPDTEGASGGPVLSGTRVQVTRIPVRRTLAVLQTSTRQIGSAMARGMTLAGLVRLRKTGDSGEKEGEELKANASLYATRPKGEHHWGMAIDLDRCVGCNACAAACYSENNIPISGQEECGRGREMAWLRIENYEGGPEGGKLLQIQGKRPEAEGSRKLDMRFLPMLCQQCENAPCEYVCPVDATVHSSDHLNQQVYNRCVGTRYCSNNCPYKVRRFNWYDFAWPTPMDQMLNPDVTKRGRGVMEKCTFCIQRIRGSVIDAKAEKRPVRDGEIVTACQQSCPADAIIFGDLNDPNSEVSHLSKDARGYGVLSELNTFPNVTYLSRVRAE